MLKNVLYTIEHLNTLGVDVANSAEAFSLQKLEKVVGILHEGLKGEFSDIFSEALTRTTEGGGDGHFLIRRAVYKALIKAHNYVEEAGVVVSGRELLFPTCSKYLWWTYPDSPLLLVNSEMFYSSSREIGRFCSLTPVSKSLNFSRIRGFWYQAQKATLAGLCKPPVDAIELLCISSTVDVDNAYETLLHDKALEKKDNVIRV